MNPFHTVFNAIAAKTINKMSPDELLAVMDAIGRQFIDTDENLAHFDPDQPAGIALMKVWGNNLPPLPKPDSPDDILQVWWDDWWDQVLDPFVARYGAIPAIADFSEKEQTLILHKPWASLDITPNTAPRQVGSDRWKKGDEKRPCIAQYHKYRDDINKVWGERQLSFPCKVTFVLPMPRSWSKQQKEEYDGQIHLATPDADNLLKAFLDSIYRNKNDSIAWSIWPEKRWGQEGKIIIQNIEIQEKIND